MAALPLSATGPPRVRPSSEAVPSWESFGGHPRRERGLPWTGAPPRRGGGFERHVPDDILAPRGTSLGPPRDCVFWTCPGRLGTTAIASSPNHRLAEISVNRSRARLPLHHRGASAPAQGLGCFHARLLLRVEGPRSLAAWVSGLSAPSPGGCALSMSIQSRCRPRRSRQVRTVCS